MSTEKDEMDESGEDRVAIIGMAGRFPGARTVTEFWENLRAGRNSMTTWTEEELAGEQTGPDYVPVKGYLAESTRFREDLFGVSAAEATVLDPQFRLLLETAWEALDDAGVPTSPEEPADVGVFTAATTSEHTLAAQTSGRLAQELGTMQVKLLTDKDYAATLLSYRLNLSGPSVTVQTACSSSLVALHQAANSVLLGECRVALAGGVSVDTTRRVGYPYYEGGIGSRTGVLRPFDVDSDGAVGGNGVGIVVLKRLDDALADGDHVHAVLLGTAIGNDGRAKVGFTAPSVDGHARVIAAAWENAGVDLSQLGYFEAHGTGTRLGDPIEVAAFAEACAALDAMPDAVIGSVKGNLGHLDTAAGVAGVIKAVCMLRERRLVATPGLSTPDPALDLAGRGLRIQTVDESFPAVCPMYVGVSSLGIGGTNAHAVLGEAPSRAHSAGSGGAQLLPLSVQTPADLPRYTAALAGAVGSSLDAVASTLQTGRRELGTRAFVVASSVEEAATALAAGREGRSARGGALGFLFPGQTARYPGLGRGMYERFGTYRAALDEYTEVLQEFGVDPLNEQPGMDTGYWQPVLVAHQLALLALLREHGLSTSHMVGHSLGEFTAAVAHGVFEPAPVLRAVAARGRLMQTTAPGAMLSVRVNADQAAELCDSEVSLAAVNGPARCVLSGDPAAVERAAKECVTRDWAHSLLPTTYGFHSVLMEPVLDQLRAVMAELTATATAGTGDWISSVTGRAGGMDVPLDPDYWVRQAREPVRYAEAAALLAERANGPLLEVGAGGDLTYLAGLEGPTGARAFATQGREPGDEVRWYLNAVGAAWCLGASVEWAALGPQRARTPLPPHPMEGRDHGALLLTREGTPEVQEAVEVQQVDVVPSAKIGVAEIFHAVLGASESELDKSFLALGGDSLKAVQVVGRLRDELGLTVSMPTLLVKDSVAELVAELTAQESDEADLIDALASVLSEVEYGGIPR